MTRYLLDVNVLIALIDPAHVQHNVAHTWFAGSGRYAWATCPLTQNGVLRIVGHSRYPNSLGTPTAVAKLMAEFLAHPGHQFWPDSLTLLDPKLCKIDRLLDSRQVSDSYLLALAVANRGKLATLYRSLITSAVVGGAEALEIIA